MYRTTRTLVYELLADSQEENKSLVDASVSKMKASQDFEHFTQMTPFQRTSAVNNLQTYCNENPNDEVMNRLLEIVGMESYDGVTVLDDK